MSAARCAALLACVVACRAAPALAEPLAVPHFRDAVVVAPNGAGRRPVIVVLHGMGDRPTSICPAFATLVHGRAWILCPRGEPFEDGDDAWTYPIDRPRVTAEVRAALAALAAAHPHDVDANEPLIAGFSLGAMFAAFLSRADAARFPRAFVIDTHYVWTSPQLATWAHAGGRAVAFACSRNYVRDCRRLAAHDGPPPGAPVPTRVRTFADREHGYDATLFALVHDDFETVVATDARW